MKRFNNTWWLHFSGQIDKDFSWYFQELSRANWLCYYRRNEKNKCRIEPITENDSLLYLLSPHTLFEDLWLHFPNVFLFIFPILFAIRNVVYIVNWQMRASAHVIWWASFLTHFVAIIDIHNWLNISSRLNNQHSFHTHRSIHNPPYSFEMEWYQI